MSLSPYGYLTLSDNLRLRYGIWRPPTPSSEQRGNVVLLNGRSEFMEKYIEVIEALNARGFTVFSMDWRGQGLSSRLLPDRLKGHIQTYQQYLDDLALFIERVVQPFTASPLIIMAHSMGGHIALRHIREAPSMFDKAVLISPMIDIKAPVVVKRIVRPMVNGLVLMGLGDKFCFGAGNYPQQRARFDGNPLTSDPVRFQRTCDIITEHPELALGGVTFAWLSATLDSIARVTQVGYATAISTPTLMVTAGQEKIVCPHAQDTLGRALPHCDHVRLASARHEILMENDTHQQRFWEAFDTFLSA